MSKRSAFQAPRFLNSFPAVQLALADIQDSLDAATRGGYSMALRIADVALTAGGFFRISAPTSNIKATLPLASAENASDVTTLCLENMAGSIVVHAPPGQLINGAATATFSGNGIVQLHSNGVDAWFSTSELPSEAGTGSLPDIPANTFLGNITGVLGPTTANSLATLAGTALTYAAGVINWDGIEIWSSAGIDQGDFIILQFADTTSVITAGGSFAGPRWQQRFERAALTGAISAAQNSNATLFAGILDNGAARADRQNLNFLTGTGIAASVTDDAGNNELEIRFQWDGVTDLSTGWASVLAKNNNSGTNNPHIDAGQFIGFGVEGSLPVTGDIRASANFDVRATGTANFQGDGSLGLFGGQIAVASGTTVNVSGTIITLAPSVDVLIDSGAGANTSLRMRETTGIAPIAADFGALWVQNTAPSRLMFTDDTDADRIVVHNGLTNVVTLAMLSNLAAGTQIGRPIDAGTGVPVALIGGEQGENIRFPTTQNVGVGGSVALNADTTNIVITANISITHFTGTDLDGRWLRIRVQPGTTVTITHGGFGVDTVNCPGGVNYVATNGDSFTVHNHLNCWHVYDKIQSGGGGSVTMTDATITLAYSGLHSGTATVVDAAILAGSKVAIFWGAVAETDENSPEMDEVSFTCTPAAGSMTVRVSSDKSPVGGAYKIRYLIG